MSQTAKTFCRNCGSTCGLIVETDNNKVVSVKGDPDHPLTQGYMCNKGNATLEWHNGEDRIIGSRAKRADGKFEKIPFEQALDEIHVKLKAIIDEHGADSVALYSGTGAATNSIAFSAMKGWMHAIGSPYCFSSMTIDQSAKWVTVARMGVFLPGKYATIDGDVIIIVGGNPLISHASGAVPIYGPKRWLKEGRDRGAKVIVIDPRQTETAKNADLHIAVDPGEDVFFFAGLINIILSKGWQDQAFLDQFTEGLDELKAAVAKFTPEIVAKRAGVSIDDLMLVAETFAKAEKKSAWSGTGTNMGPYSNTTEHMTELLNAVCGGYRRRGDTVVNMMPISGGAITKEMVFPPNRSWESGPRLRSVDLGPIFGEYPTSLLPLEIAHKGEKRIRALFVVGGNPLKALPDPALTAECFSNLDLLVTLDPRMSETCEISDYVISTSLHYERHDTLAMNDRFQFFSYVNATKPLVQRPEGIVDEWEVFYGLCQRMGLPYEIKLNMYGASHEQVPGPVMEFDMENKPSTQDIVAWMVSRGTTNYEDVIAAEHGIWFKDQKATVEPADEDCAKLMLLPPDVAEELEEVFNTEKAEEPYRLIVRRTLETMNSAFNHSSVARERFPVNPTYMNTEDMAEHGLNNGDRVEVRSAYGKVVGHARKDPGLKRGVVSITNGWGSMNPDTDGEEGTNPTALSSLLEHRTTINYMPRISAVPVSVVKA